MNRPDNIDKQVWDSGKEGKDYGSPSAAGASRVASLDPDTRVAVREVLVAAKELIADPKDWCGDGGANGGGISNGSMCVAWSLRHAANAVGAFNNLTFKEMDRFGDALASALGQPTFEVIPEWNDSPDTTHEMVMDAFDKAIASVTPTGADTAEDTTTTLPASEAQPHNPSVNEISTSGNPSVDAGLAGELQNIDRRDCETRHRPTPSNALSVMGVER